MKKIAFILMLIIPLLSFNSTNPKVLMFVQDNSYDLGFMLKNEVGVMKQILEQSGFTVEIATISGEELKTDSISIQPDFKLSQVSVKKYQGFIIPCMAADDSIVTPAERSFVKEILNINKPLAAQTSGVLILAKSGALNGKKYAFMEANMDELAAEFKNSIYEGIGVVQDGNIITSGICPMMAKTTGKKNGTAELTNKLVEAVKAQL